MTKAVLQLIDSHAHIYGPEFRDDFDAMMTRAREAGVAEIIVPGADLASSREAVALARQHPGLYAAVGIHPHDAAAVTPACMDEIRTLALESGAVAIGEVGLDFYRDRAPRPVQEEVFRRFIALARELELPLIIHDRDAHDRIMAILAEERAGDVGGVLHCFSGDAEMARRCIDMGFLISIPGTVTYANNHGLHEVVRATRVESMLMETDAPYLAPVPFRGKRNEPAHVRLAAARVAELKGLSLEDVARITTLNARRLFRLPDESREFSPIAYAIRNSLYLNITNRCSNRCSFCPKFQDFTVKGHNLRLRQEPTAGEVLAAIGDPRSYDEVVFCGYGEPLLRLDLIREVAARLKEQGVTVRINTDGLANRVHGRNILPELAGLVDVVSVSLNAADAAAYAELCRPPFGDDAFPAVCDFIREATRHIPTVIATAVALPGLDTAPIRRLAESLGAVYRERPYADVG